MTSSRIPSIDDRVAELLAQAPPLTDEQRNQAVRILATAPPARSPARAA